MHKGFRIEIRHIALFAIFLLLASTPQCKKSPTTAEPEPPEVPQPAITLTCNPNSGITDAEITISISIQSNQEEIKVFGLDLTFDVKMFMFISASPGELTGTWAAVDGNEISAGTLRIGGFVGSGTAIPVGSEGNMATVKLKVTGDEYNNGQQSQVCINNYTDDIAGISPDPACVQFTYVK